MLKRADRARRPQMVSTMRLQSLVLLKLRHLKSVKAYGGVRKSECIIKHMGHKRMSSRVVRIY